MSYSNSEISLYVDTMIVEALLTDSHLLKTAQEGGMASQLVSKVQGYFSNNIDKSDPGGSLVNMLAPGALSMTLGAIGLPWLGVLLALCLRVFHIDVNSIISSVWTKVKEAVGAKQQMTSQQIDSAVDEAVQKNTKDATEQEAAQATEAEKTIEKKNNSQLLRDAKLLKLAMIEFEQSSFTKQSGFLGAFNKRKASTGTLLGTVLKWIFKIAIASAGFMVAGDVINKFLGRSNALDGTVQNGKPVGGNAAAPVQAIPQVVPKQTKFKPNPAYHVESYNTGDDSWIENVPNNKGSIANLLLRWTKEVYQGLDGLDGIIQNTAGFQTLVETIAWHNIRSENGPIVFIPSVFTSKKSIVDHFIDEVAEKAP